MIADKGRSAEAVPLTTQAVSKGVKGYAESIGRCSVVASKRARVEVARARRRVIFNDDTYELSRDDVGTPEGFLSRRLKPLAGTHVSTVAWSVLGGAADAPVYDSKVQPTYGDAHGGPQGWPKVTGNISRWSRAGSVRSRP